MHNCADCGSFENVTPEEVQRWLRANEVLLVDVREPAEYMAERIEGALLAPVSAFDPDAVLEEAGDRRIVFYCKVGGRADRICRFFVEETGRHATCMEGSILGWKAQGLPVVPG